MADYFLVAGLGNPSEKYEATRHNAGFWFVEALAAEAGVEFKTQNRFSGTVATIECAGRTVFLLKPATYMNQSGRSVATLAKYYKIASQSILVAHDDLDFSAGTARLKRNGGAGGHNGLKDIIANLGEREFMRLRLGIGHPEDRSQVLGYVLGRPSTEDREAILGVIAEAARIVPDIVTGNIDRAMETLHSNKLQASKNQ